MLEVHGGLLAWTVITFLILLVVLKKIAWGPIISALETRETEIRDALNSAEKARKDAEKATNEYEELMRKAQIEAQQIIAEGKSAGERIKNDIEVKASEKADAIIAKAKDQIEVERKNAIQDIRTSVIALSMQAAAKVIEKNLDSNDNRELIDKAIERVGQG